MARAWWWQQQEVVVMSQQRGVVMGMGWTKKKELEQVSLMLLMEGVRQEHEMQGEDVMMKEQGWVWGWASP